MVGGVDLRHFVIIVLYLVSGVALQDGSATTPSTTTVTAPNGLNGSTPATFAAPVLRLIKPDNINVPNVVGGDIIDFPILRTRPPTTTQKPTESTSGATTTQLPSRTSDGTTPPTSSGLPAHLDPGDNDTNVLIPNFFFPQNNGTSTETPDISPQTQKTTTLDTAGVLPGEIYVETGRFYGQLDFTVPEYRYLAPILLVLLLLMTVCMVFAILRQMKGASTMTKASCLFIIAIGIADILTVSVAIPEIVFRHSMKDQYGVLPYDSCLTMLVLERLSAIPHTASVWLTVALAVQRYICISRPFSAKTLIKIKYTLITIAGTVLVSIGLYISRFVGIKFYEVDVTSTTTQPSDTPTSCSLGYAEWIQDPVVYETVFAWIRIILVKCFPSILLIIFAALVGRVLSQSAGVLKDMNINDTKRQQSDRRRLSVFVIVVAVLVCVIEIPSGILLSLNIIGVTRRKAIIDYTTLKKIAISLDLALYATYFCVFLVYCLMSRDVRQLLWRLLKFCPCRYVTERFRVLQKDSSAAKSATASTEMLSTQTQSGADDNLLNREHTTHTDNL